MPPGKQCSHPAPLHLLCSHSLPSFLLTLFFPSFHATFLYSVSTFPFGMLHFPLSLLPLVYRFFFSNHLISLSFFLESICRLFIWPSLSDHLFVCLCLFVHLVASAFFLLETLPPSLSLSVCLHCILHEVQWGLLAGRDLIASNRVTLAHQMSLRNPQKKKRNLNATRVTKHSSIPKACLVTFYRTQMKDHMASPYCFSFC